jgi:hypothetical protein
MFLPAVDALVKAAAPWTGEIERAVRAYVVSQELPQG